MTRANVVTWREGLVEGIPYDSDIEAARAAAQRLVEERR
jgi:hypothetical protein